MADPKKTLEEEAYEKGEEMGYDLEEASKEMMAKTNELLQGSEAFKALVKEYNEDKLDAEKLKKKVHKEVPVILEKVEKLKNSLVKLGRVIERKAHHLVKIVEKGVAGRKRLPQNSRVADDYGLIPVMFHQVRDRIQETFGELEQKAEKNPDLKPVFDALNEIKGSLEKLASKAQEMGEQVKAFLNYEYYQGDVPPKEDPERGKQIGNLIGSRRDEK
ncbi:MAG: hypothetical protein LUC43_03995 [Burkholderiales bacterium]|nr:hypothetical protein [Burkholderiales bacterium]